MFNRLSERIVRQLISDTTYQFSSTSQNCHVTETRDKRDTTSSYIYHERDVAVYVEVCSYGINYTAGSGRYLVRPGNSQYLYNYVKENGRDNCYLRIYSTTNRAVTLKGKWSPDSV